MKCGGIHSKTKKEEIQTMKEIGVEVNEDRNKMYEH
jgi:biotin operon repressor